MPLFSQISHRTLESGVFTIIILLSHLGFLVLSGAIVFYKFKNYWANYRNDENFIRRYNNDLSIRNFKIKKDCGPLERICDAGVQEFNHLLTEMIALTKQNIKTPSLVVDNYINIIRESLEEKVSLENLKNDNLLVYLAVVSSTSPLLGLLGTVWGIMLAFLDIDRLGNASITTVAPGIAAALVTPATGLVVAVPALIAYNYFTNKNTVLETDAINFSSSLLRKIKKEFFSLVYGAPGNNA